MNEKRIDRRIQKTRKYLSDALVSLIIEKGYDDVTVQDIIDRANVGRSTFYAHFENKEQLLFSGDMTFKQMLEQDEIPSDEKSTRENGGQGPGINFTALYDHVSEYHQLAKAMIGKKGGELVTAHLRDIMAMKINDYIKRQGRITPEKTTLISEAAAAAMVSLLGTWLEEGMEMSVETISRLSNELLLKMVG